MRPGLAKKWLEWVCRFRNGNVAVDVSTIQATGLLCVSVVQSESAFKLLGFPFLVHLYPVAQWVASVFSFLGFPFKVNQPKKDALFFLWPLRI